MYERRSLTIIATKFLLLNLILVLGAHARLYDTVFERAQERLRKVFGMEMTELTTKGRSGKNDEKGITRLGSAGFYFLAYTSTTSCRK